MESSNEKRSPTTRQTGALGVNAVPFVQHPTAKLGSYHCIDTRTYQAMTGWGLACTSTCVSRTISATTAPAQPKLLDATKAPQTRLQTKVWDLFNMLASLMSF